MNIPWSENDTPRLLTDEELCSDRSFPVEVAYFGQGGHSVVLTYADVDQVEPYVCAPSGEVLTMTPPGEGEADFGDECACETRRDWARRGLVPARFLQDGMDERVVEVMAVE